MRRMLALVLSIAISVCSFAADNSYKITYDGGSVPNAKTGSGLKLFIDSN